MLLLELLSRLQNSNTSLLFWNLFTGLKFLNELNIKSSLSQNSQYHSAFVSIWPRIYSASSRSQHTLFTLCHSHQTIIITQSHSPLLPTCFTSSLEPASCITQNSSSKLFSLSQRPSFEHAGLTCYTLLYTFHHFFTVSLWAQNLPFQKILSYTLVCFCLSDWSHGSRLFTGLICSSVLCFSSIFSVLVIPKRGRLSWQLANF